jgi:multisubunit Na+/H+ antiporter MnhF subunit
MEVRALIVMIVLHQMSLVDRWHGRPFDSLYVNTVAVAVVNGIRYGSFVYFRRRSSSLMGFVSTVALARYTARGKVLD